MGIHLIKLPDVGEGVAEAEIVEWLVEEGAEVKEDETLASVMTDKATVEIPAPVSGVVRWLGGEIGESIAVGAPLIRIETADAGNTEDNVDNSGKANDAVAAGGDEKTPVETAPETASAPAIGGKPVLAAPAVRARAARLGVDLGTLRGTGPDGRVTHADLDAALAKGGVSAPNAGAAPRDAVREVPIIGLRRKIAENIAEAASCIPHISYVEEIDVTDLETLRATMNETRGEGREKLTLLPFLMAAMARAIEEQPQFNAHYDVDAGVLREAAGVHIGVATQTEQGLVVPVVRNVEARSVWECAGEVARLAQAARDGTCAREELTGSTITITSLGALGGVVTTPVINKPEVAIVGVNRIRTLPRWEGEGFVPRKMMNLSSSVDHRIIDGWDIAVFVQKIKTRLETPALIFIDD